MRHLKTCLVAMLACAAIAVIWTAPPALAFNKSVERACKDDYKRLCPSYKPTSPQLRACMESKANEITPSCIDALIDAGEVDRRRSRRRSS